MNPVNKGFTVLRDIAPVLSFWTMSVLDEKKIIKLERQPEWDETNPES